MFNLDTIEKLSREYYDSVGTEVETLEIEVDKKFFWLVTDYVEKLASKLVINSKNTIGTSYLDVMTSSGVVRIRIKGS